MTVFKTAALFLLSFATLSAAAYTDPVKLRCSIDREFEHSAGIPVVTDNNIIRKNLKTPSFTIEINKSGAVAEFLFPHGKMPGDLYPMNPELSHDLTVKIDLKYVQQVNSNFGKYNVYASSTSQFQLYISEILKQSEFMPQAHLFTKYTPQNSSGNQFYCSEIDSQGRVKKYRMHSSAE